MTTMRVHTRLAHMMDPVTQPDPWDVNLNSDPNSADKRLGDGTYRGPPAYAASILRAYPDTTGNGGYDFVWTHTKEFGNKTRGALHQSAVVQVRYDSLTTCGDNPQGESTGPGDAPIVLAAENDLMGAEALIRGPANLTIAATLIMNTRVVPDRLRHLRVRSGVERRSPDAEGAADLDADVSGAASFHAREPAAEEPAIARRWEFPVDQRVPPGRCVAAGGTTGARHNN